MTIQAISSTDTEDTLHRCPARLSPAGTLSFDEGNSIVVDSKHKFLYAVSSMTGQSFILTYAIQPNGDLAPLSGPGNIIAGQFGGLALDPGGKLLILQCWRCYRVLHRSQQWGPDAEFPDRLTPNPGAGPAMAVDPYGRFVYLATNDGVTGYQINRSTGALTLIPGAPFAAGEFTDAVTADPTGRFLYATNEYGGENQGGEGTISGYRVNQSTGELTPIPGSPFPTGYGAGSAEPWTRAADSSISPSRVPTRLVATSFIRLPGALLPSGIRPHRYTTRSRGGG